MTAAEHFPTEHLRTPSERRMDGVSALILRHPHLFEPLQEFHDTYAAPPANPHRGLRGPGDEDAADFDDIVSYGTVGQSVIVVRQKYGHDTNGESYFAQKLSYIERASDYIWESRRLEVYTDDRHCEGKGDSLRRKLIVGNASLWLSGQHGGNYWRGHHEEGHLADARHLITNLEYQLKKQEEAKITATLTIVH